MRKTLAAGVLGVFMVISACTSSEQQTKTRCLRLNIKEEPTSLDPRRGRNMTGPSHLQAMLFEGLMRIEPDGKLACAQARSYEISEDGKTYTFHLGNTFWSDGTPVTAFDFEKTWKNILDPLFPALDSHLLYNIRNAEAAKKGELPLEQVGIKAKDAKTLQIELGQPTPHFIYITASSSLFPINQSQEKQSANWHVNANQHFTSNGPFKLTKWKHHNLLIFEKNHKYRLADQVNLDSIHVSMINNEPATLHMFESGKLDIIGLPISPLPIDSYPRLIENKQLKVFESPGTMVCMFNTKQFPFYNTNMRKAFSYAINRQLLIDNVTQLEEKPAYGLIPPVIRQGKHNAYFEDGNAELARTYFQQGLNELGITADALKDKVSFCYWTHDHACPTLPQAMQQQWMEVLGVDVELEGLEYKTLHERGRNEHFSMGYFVFLSMYYDPIELLDRFKHPTNPRNYGRWENGTFIDLMNQAATSSSYEEHSILLEQAEQIMMEDMPFAPVFHWNYALLVQPHVQGFSVTPQGYLNVDRVSINKTQVHEKKS